MRVALRSGTVGSDVYGYWNVAFNDDVLFVFVDGDEVAQGEYAWSLVALLGAPIVGGVALAIAGLALAGPRRRITPAEPPD